MHTHMKEYEPSYYPLLPSLLSIPTWLSVEPEQFLTAAPELGKKLACEEVNPCLEMHLHVCLEVLFNSEHLSEQHTAKILTLQVPRVS